MIRRLGLLILIASPNLAFAVDKNIQELQRDVALLQDQIKQLQIAQDTKFAALQTLVQQAVDASIRADRDVAVIQNGFQQSGKELANSVVTPVVGLGTRLDQVSGDVRTLQQAVSDLTSSMAKMNAQLSDIGIAIKALSVPATPPPAQQQATVPGAPGGSSMPPMNQKDMYDAAKGDYLTGKMDIATQEFQDFLKYYGTSDLASSAQYYIASIQYSNKNYEAAAREFDMMIEKYPEDAKTKDARLYKALSLVAISKRNDAVPIFKDLITRYPGTDQAVRACTELKSLAINCPKPAPPARSSARKNGRDDL